jgi:GntR family negative regulator for fad regulon and positive regulator of fabA
MEWTAQLKPAELCENRLIDAILEGVFPIGSVLPGERELAQKLKVTRPTLREALQRLGRDGWLEIHQGKATRVKDYWHEGNLGVLGAIALRIQYQSPDFVPNLLYVRMVMAPAYTELAVEREAVSVCKVIEEYEMLPDLPGPFATFDWYLHHKLTIFSGNPIFTLILNGFAELYPPMACRYFELSDSRQSSRRYYAGLLQAAQSGDAVLASEITRQVMLDSIELWNHSTGLER